jgi:RNA polymerase sporulation-specific sigma factor
VLPGPSTHDPVNQVISSEEVESLTGCLSRTLSDLEGRVLRQYLNGLSYERIAAELGCDCKTVDNALQRIKRKVDLHLESRKVLS